MTRARLSSRSSRRRWPGAPLAACLALLSVGAGCMFELAPPAEEMLNPRPIVLATSQPEPWSIAVDDTHVYWTNLSVNAPGSGALMRIRKDKSSPVTPIARAQDVRAVALDDTHVYWTTLVSGDGRVARRLKSGGTTEILASNQSSPVGLAVDTSNVYWTDAGRGTVSRRAKNAPTAVPVVLASGQVVPWLLALTSDTVYWTNREGRAVMRVAKDGSTPPRLVAAALDDVFGIAVDETAIFWRDADADRQGRVMRLTLDGSPPQTLATTTGEGARFLALDGSNVYWTDGSNSDGSVMTALRDGTGVIELAGALPGPRGIAVDGTDVYWSNYSGATVMKTPKTRNVAARSISRAGP